MNREPLKTEVPDYEPCGTCGFDHAYEPVEAAFEHQRQEMLSAT